MSENIKGSPSLIQRNVLDVATELTQLYYDHYQIGTMEDIQKVFLQFCAVADMGRMLGCKALAELLPKDQQELLERYYK